MACRGIKQDTDHDLLYHILLQRQLRQILNILKTTPMNVAMCATVNHSGTIVTDPLRDVITGKEYPTAKEMAANIGTHFMASLVQAGIAHYDIRKYRVRLYDASKTALKDKMKEKKMKQKENERDEASDDIGLEEGDKILDVLKSLVEQRELPDVETLQVFLKKDFESLDEHQYLFLQSVLKDLWILQKWNQPLNWAQERKLSLKETHIKQTEDEDVIIEGGLSSHSLIPRGVSFNKPKKIGVSILPLTSTSTTPAKVTNGKMTTPNGHDTFLSSSSMSSSKSKKQFDAGPKAIHLVHAKGNTSNLSKGEKKDYFFTLFIQVLPIIYMLILFFLLQIQFYTHLYP